MVLWQTTRAPQHVSTSQSIAKVLRDPPPSTHPLFDKILSKPVTSLSHQFPESLEILEQELLDSSCISLLQILTLEFTSIHYLPNPRLSPGDIKSQMRCGLCPQSDIQVNNFRIQAHVEICPRFCRNTGEENEIKWDFGYFLKEGTLNLV